MSIIKILVNASNEHSMGFYTECYIRSTMNISKFREKEDTKKKTIPGKFNETNFIHHPIEVTVYSFRFKIFVRPSTTNHHHMKTFSTNQILFWLLQSNVESVSF